MRAFIVLGLAFLSFLAVAETDHGGVIRKTVKTEAIGLNGKIVLSRGYLYLRTPSGKGVQLVTRNNPKLQSELDDLANSYAELSGTFVDGRLEVKKVESKGLEHVGFLVDLKEGNHDRFKAWVRNHPEMKLRFVSDDILSITSDLSLASFKKLLDESDYASEVEVVARDIRLKIQIDEPVDPSSEDPR